MSQYIDKKIDLDDFNMLKDIFNSNNRKLEIDIIDALGDIYFLADQIVYNQEVIKKNYKYLFNTCGNFLKSSVFSVASYIAIINYLDKDPELFYSFCNCFVPSVVGWTLFQKDNKKDNYVTKDELYEAYENYLNFQEQLQSSTEFYFKTMKLYFGKSPLSIKNEMRRIFENNREYIETNVKNGRFLDDFSYDTILDVCEEYMSDDIFNDFMSFYDSNKKQRKL